MKSQLEKRLKKLEQPNDVDTMAWTNFQCELYARWLCADRIPGETAEEAASLRTPGPQDYKRPWPTDDAVLLQVAYEHAVFEGFTQAETPEAWQAARMAELTNGGNPDFDPVDIFLRSGERIRAKEQEQS